VSNRNYSSRPAAEDPTHGDAATKIIALLRWVGVLLRRNKTAVKAINQMKASELESMQMQTSVSASTNADRHAQIP